MTSDTRHTKDHGDDVAKLIRLAGQRPPIPEDRIQRAREAAHATWRSETRRRSRNRYVWGAVALAAAASLVVLAVNSFLPRQEVMRAGVGGALPVRLLAGQAQIRNVGGERLSPPRALAASESVPLNSVLTTSDSSRAAVRLPSGHSLRLDLSTRVRLQDSKTLHLDRGAIYLASASGSRILKALTVETSLGAIREIGTQFEVRLASDAVRVRVREGAIVLRHDDAEHEVEVGTELELAANGSTRTREIMTHGPEWDWVSGITPMLDLEGRTARTFLDWVAREQGWNLAFADDALALSAETIVVAGDIDGMTIEQALAAVLPSCQMLHRVSDGTLLVEAMP
jgi:ferric-dicitrate binding protein FerR (iron transport regulator)